MLVVQVGVSGNLLWLPTSRLQVLPEFQDRDRTTVHLSWLFEFEPGRPWKVSGRERKGDTLAS